MESLVDSVYLLPTVLLFTQQFVQYLPCEHSPCGSWWIGDIIHHLGPQVVWPTEYYQSKGYQ